TAEVADEVDRGCRLATGAAEVRERARERDVVDVVTRRVGHGTVLAPPGHAPVDEPGVAREAHVGAETETLHHTGPEALGQRVGLPDETEQGLDAVGVLEVDADGAPAAVHHRYRARVGASLDGLDPVDVE